MNRDRDKTTYIYWRLGKEGVSFGDVALLLRNAVSRSRAPQPGRVELAGSGIVITYNPGMDGLDSWFGIEEPA